MTQTVDTSVLTLGLARTTLIQGRTMRLPTADAVGSSHRTSASEN
jgi:hypothetical protein